MSFIINLILGLIGVAYLFLIYRKWDLLTEKVNRVFKQEVMPATKMELLYPFFASTVVFAGVALLLSLVVGAPAGNDFFALIEQSPLYLVAYIISYGGIVVFYAYYGITPENRKSGVVKGIFYLASTILISLSMLMISVLSILIAIIAAIWIWRLVSGGGSTNEKRYICDDVIITRKGGFPFGYHYEGDDGCSYGTDDGGKSFYKK